MQIRIHTAKNGFIVYPLQKDVASISTSKEKEYIFNNDEVLVFETFKSLVAELEKMFNPITIVPDGLNAPIKPQRPEDLPKMRQ